MPNYSPQDALKPSAVSTAHHMADALSFLMRVATEAGLRNVAAKLANVRSNLLDLTVNQTDEDGDPTVEDTSAPSSPSVKGNSDARRKLS
jgi:hypothetical protein